jgi:PAS domain-containing protein
MKLSRQLLLAMVALTAATAALVGIFIYRDMEESIVPVEMRRLEATAQLLANGLDGHARSARADTLAMRGSVGVDGIVRAHQAGGRDPLTGVSEDVLKGNLAQLFQAMLNAKPNYLKLRFIGLADGGKELVRVDRLGDGSVVRRVPEAELQRKGDRVFVPETIALEAGQVYVSPVDLNQEQGAIAFPLMPVMRTGTPVYDAAGTPFGLILINLDMRAAFDELRSHADRNTRLYVTNEAGDFLVHPDPKREFSFEFGTPVRLRQEMPNVRIAPGQRAGHAAVTIDGERYAAAFAEAQLAGGPWLTVVKAVPYEHILAPMTRIRNSALIAGAIAAVLAGLLAVGLARSLARPIGIMTVAVENLRSGRPAELPVSSSGEVGVLARAFRHYVQSERMFSAALESSDDAVIATTPDGVITGWNPAAERLYGYTAIRRPKPSASHRSSSCPMTSATITSSGSAPSRAVRGSATGR